MSSLPILHEFPALPSNNAFLSLPTIVSVCFTSPACSFSSILNKPVTSLTLPLLSQTASLQFSFPHCSRPITSQALLSSLIPSLPIPATESKLPSVSSKPLPQHSQSFTSETPFSCLIPSLSVPAAKSELSSAYSIPFPHHSQQWWTGSENSSCQESVRAHTYL
ncbi:hypothetical protein AVEN_224600-1 [Araneus ventricosus]|uniref:Uncharacterized protein n=1 Tax=Araneus ventricosus TaxID=182803 RepID=A0A4Y2N628_ARAVE|nr:hypothetical protein AVEN_224600-1 [Araneus ventricosus]